MSITPHLISLHHHRHHHHVTHAHRHSHSQHIHLHTHGHTKITCSVTPAGHVIAHATAGPNVGYLVNVQC